MNPADPRQSIENRELSYPRYQKVVSHDLAHDKPKILYGSSIYVLEGKRKKCISFRQGAQ
jgi:hypothetical protein